MKLFFRKQGEGFPLIILHGLFGTADNWNTLGKSYGNFFTTYLVDQRNHGQSFHSDEWNYQVMVEDLKNLMDAEGIEKAHIMGHSMGGKTAMLFAITYPERVEKLIISDIAPRYYSPHHQQIIAGLKAVDLGTVQSRKEAEQALFSVIDDQGTGMFLLKNLYWKSEGQLAWRFNLDAIVANINNVGEEIPKNAHYSGETLFVRGGNSGYIKERDEEDIRRIFSNVHIVTIENAGHWVHAEKPQEYVDVTLEFLR